MVVGKLKRQDGTIVFLRSDGRWVAKDKALTHYLNAHCGLDPIRPQEPGIPFYFSLLAEAARRTQSKILWAMPFERVTNEIN